MATGTGVATAETEADGITAPVWGTVVFANGAPEEVGVVGSSQPHSRIHSKGVQGSYTQAPMKLLYELAFALQILLPKQIKVDIIMTGRLPKHV